MEVPLFVIADFASSSAGKVNIIGTFTTLHAKRLPVIHAHMYLVAQVVGEPTEYGRDAKFEIKLSDEDGHQIFSSTNQLKLPSERTRERPQINVIVPILNMVFEKAGTYEFSIAINDELKSERVLDIILID